MNIMKKIEAVFNSRAGSYIFYVLAVSAFVFIKSATFTYGWIAELYPMGQNFVSMIFGVIGVLAVILFVYITLIAISIKDKQNIVIRIVHIISEIAGAILFIYTFVLIFGFDKGIAADRIANGIQYLIPNLLLLGVMAMIPLPMLFTESPKKALKSLIVSVLTAALVVVPLGIDPNEILLLSESSIATINFKSENVIEGAKINYESLKNGEKADAENLLIDNNKCWSPQKPSNVVEFGKEDANNSIAEIQLSKAETFNTAVIEESGNNVQYFRIQAYIDDEWMTIYQSEKIQSMKICSFDAVTTDKIRLSIDKFRSDNTAAKIKTIRLYNEKSIDVSDFEASVYQRLDADVPSEILKKGKSFAENYAKFYDVYSTVIVFGAINWDEDGKINFGSKGEESFAKEIDALKKIISLRTNKNHEVKLIITALADGTGGNHGGVNVFMSKHMEKVADQIIELVSKYDFDGVDIDWEYPANSDDWKNYDKFIAKLDDGINKSGNKRIISTALSSGNLGLSKDTFDRLDQIQFMAYDGCDTDGYQSSLQQAQEGITAFMKNGADISKINVGIAAYGRPLNGTPFWATWRDLKQANYWDSKYYNVEDSNQIYDGTFCSPALAADKTAYALLSGCGGVMVFRIGCDKTMDDSNSVACGVQNALSRYADIW